MGFRQNFEVYVLSLYLTIFQLEETFICVKKKLMYFHWGILSFLDLFSYVYHISYFDKPESLVNFLKQLEYINSFFKCCKINFRMAYSDQEYDCKKSSILYKIFEL